MTAPAYRPRWVNRKSPTTRVSAATPAGNENAQSCPCLALCASEMITFALHHAGAMKTHDHDVPILIQNRIVGHDPFLIMSGVDAAARMRSALRGALTDVWP